MDRSVTYGGKLSDSIRQGRTNYGDQYMRCPACGATAKCEAVDVGVGLYLRGDYTCSRCDWEINGPGDFGFVGCDDVPPAPVDPAVYEEIMSAVPEWLTDVPGPIGSYRYQKD